MLGQAGEHPRGIGQHRRDVPVIAASTDELSLRGGGDLGGEQGIDVEAVAEVRGDATRGRVRLGDQPQVREIRHHVAHRGGAHLQTVAADDRPGTHRQGRGDVVLDDRPQDRLLTRFDFQWIHYFQ